MFKKLEEAGPALVRSIRSGRGNVVYNENLNRTFAGFEFKAQLLFECGKD